MLSKSSFIKLGLGLVLSLCLAMMWIVLVGDREVPVSPTRPGRPAPEFSLTDLNGNSVSLSQFRGRPVLLIFSSVRCPLSSEYSDRIVAFANRLAEGKQAAVVAIDSDLKHPGAATSEEIRVHSRLAGTTYPTLIDCGGKVARQYRVTQTPTVCLIDEIGAIRYAGPFDDNRDLAMVKARYCDQAVAALLNSHAEPVLITQALGLPSGAPR